ncbi:hypothetical protein N184_25315 [Sinorhizobium sp. GL28]|nr:hypothetical protein N184_25315 [Sinorhizobium sp. GL28]
MPAAGMLANISAISTVQSHNVGLLWLRVGILDIVRQ